MIMVLRLRRTVALLAICALVLLVSAACAGLAPAPEIADAEPTRELAYDFTLETLDGDPVILSDLQGDWVLVNFWATWCPPCVREMPYLQEIADTRNLHVLGINMGESEKLVQRFAEKHAIDFPILMGADQVLTIAYNARSLPQTYVVAPDGTVALRVVGAIEPETFDPWLDEQGIGRN